MFRYALILFIAVLPGYSLAAASECEVEEYMRMGLPRYDDLLCSGEQYFRLGMYDKAVEQFLQAERMPLFPEEPNYKLNARIAHTYLLMGNLERAHHFLVRSKIALSVLERIYACGDDSTIPFSPITDDQGHPITSAAGAEVSGAMCGGGYVTAYIDKLKALGASIVEGKLVEYHYRVARLIAEALTLGQDEVYPYGEGYPAESPTVVLRGIITKEQRFGYPGYGKTPEKDQQSDAYVLALEQPITVGTPGTLSYFDDIPMIDVSKVELVFRDRNVRKSLIQLVDKHVVLQGGLFDPRLSDYSCPVKLEVFSVSQSP